MTFVAEIWRAVSEFAATPGGKVVGGTFLAFVVMTVLVNKIGGRR